MSYYAGGYYAGGQYSGGYYAGGFFSNIIHGIGGALKGAVGGILSGNPLKAITGAVGGAIQGVGRADIEAAGPRGLTDTELAALHARDTRLKAAGRKLPALPGQPPGMALMAMPGGGALGGGMLMRGYRWNKSTYVTRGGGTSRWPVGLTIHPKHTEPVKTRRMNVANPRALRRGLRRAAGFVKLARRAHVRLAAFTGRGKKKKKK